ncbi:DeoR/GlpR family DNA-binding transcription regulator [Faecalibaculum rodentium]|uniref:DeoR/GlpR family DNA-binding transcription regulator n=2 Tax=Faecalibaculum rodentium TaxID=1702221 RepID=UPI0023F2FA11|nr:DeoR/GlpR family DNA-binding transcription regulator [Faecalibaculum rodentium]
MQKRKEQRLTDLRKILEEQGRVRTRDLAKMLDVTPETLRSDLDLLESQGLIEREHGAARLRVLDKETPLEWRQAENRQEKMQVTIRALQEVKDGDIVFIDAGSTILTALNHLSSRRDLTIVVNSLPAAQSCLDMGFHCLFIGGQMRRSGGHTYGYFAEQMVDNITIDIAILGTTGIEGVDGFSVYRAEEVGIRRHIIRQTRRLVIVMGRHKLNQPGYYRYASFREADLLVTNHLTPEQKKRFSGVRQIVEV